MTEERGKAWLKKVTKPYGGSVLFLALLSVFVTLSTLAFAYLVRYLINSATDGNAKKLWAFSAILLGILLLKILLKTLNGFLSEKLRAKMYSNLRGKVFSKILRSDYARLQDYHSGDLLTRLTSDVQEICVDTVGFAPTLAGMAVQCLGAITALLTIDPIFTAIYIVCGCIFGGITALFRRQLKKRHREVLETDGRVRAFMQEGLTSVMTVKAYCAEGQAEEKAQRLSTSYYNKRMRRNTMRAQMNFVFALLSNFGLIFAVVWCSVSVLNGNSDYGAILSVILLLLQLQQPLASVSSVLPVYYARAASAERLAEIDGIEEEEAATPKENIFDLYDKMHSLQICALSFSYARENVLENVNAQIKKGELLCLTGASGSGKSTFFKLLLCVFKPSAGKIILNGDYGAKELSASERALFAYVPQRNFLFSGTIYENLTFFTEWKPSEEEIRKALTVACAEFVYELPDGLHTKLSEGGEGLSEGQLQRLNVARAVLSNRPILLLDEATSALDGETEKRLLENVRQLKDRTCLFVTHRDAALGIADRILRVENKGIYEQKK